MKNRKQRLRLHVGNQKQLEHSVLNLKGKEWQELGLKKGEELVEICFRYWRARGFPYYNLSDFEMAEEYRRIEAVKKERILLGDEVQMSMVGVKLANYFHPHMWGVKVNRAYSPLERFNSDEKLRRLIRRALTIWPDRYSVNESNLRRMLKTFSNTAGVSNFRPTGAKAIYEKYSKDGDFVLDFSAGYGGRLLGCMPLDRHYLGIDPCQEQIRGLRKMIAKLNKLVKLKAQISIQQACAEDFMPTMRANSVSLVFSSPPYFNHERYSNEPSQSYIKYPTYNEWLEAFMKSIISQSYRILKQDGYFVLNVADVNSFKLTDDALLLASRNFRLSDVLKMRLGHKPYLRNRTGKVYKYEPIFVFRKAKS